MQKKALKRHTKLAVRLGLLLQQHKLTLTTAESCTGGWIAHVLTSVPTSSGWFERGFVTYSKDSKIALLNVKEETLNHFGVVSEQTAIEMAEGALKNSLANVSLSITGLAGPQSKEGISVGTCWFAWSSENFFPTKSKCKFFKGDRFNINSQAVEFAISSLIKLLSEKK